MKILYFHQHFSTPKGAVGTRSYEMASRLVKEGHDVTMVCGSYSNGVTGLDIPFKNGKRIGQVNGISIIEFDLAYSNKDGFIKRSLVFLKFALRSMQVAVFEKSDLVFSTSTPLTAALPGIAAKWIRRRPFVFEVRDLWPELPRAMGVITNRPVLWSMAVLEWLAYKSADRLIGLSPGIAKGLGRFGKDPNKIAMIPNGCDVSLFQDDVEAWRPKGVAETDFLAIFTGTHGLANGLDAVVDAAAILKQRSARSIKLLLVGDGMKKPALMHRVESEGLGDYILFHDPVPKKRLAGLMASADLGMQILVDIPVFYYGTSPNKFFDYLAAGLPVITNYPGWVADLVTENNCGIAVPPNDAEAFAEAVLELAEIPDRKLSMKAKGLAAQTFHRDILAQKWVNFMIDSPSQ